MALPVPVLYVYLVLRDQRLVAQLDQLVLS